MPDKSVYETRCVREPCKSLIRSLPGVGLLLGWHLRGIADEVSCTANQQIGNRKSKPLQSVGCGFSRTWGGIATVPGRRDIHTWYSGRAKTQLRNAIVAGSSDSFVENQSEEMAAPFGSIKALRDDSSVANPVT